MPSQSDAEPPTFTGRRLLLGVTGAVGAMFTPMWVAWLRDHYPDCEVRVVLTPSAHHFVGATVVEAFAKGTITDSWDGQVRRADHVDLALWPDCVLVHPATMAFIARLATGQADSPLMLALQCTGAPVVVAAALPPGGDSSWAFARHRDVLASRPGLDLVEPMPGLSLATGHQDACPAVPLPVAVGRLAALMNAPKEAA